MCNEKRKPGSGQQQCLWERFKCSEHSGTNEKGCSLRRDEGRIGTPLWSGVYIISVSRRVLFELTEKLALGAGLPHPHFLTKCVCFKVSSKVWGWAQAPLIPQFCDRVGIEQQNTPIIKT